MPKPTTVVESRGVLDAIYERRSELDAAVQAPTPPREPPWAFAVIQDRAPEVLSWKTGLSA